jgi:hypothetical protein
MGKGSTRLMTTNPARGLVFVAVVAEGRYDQKDYIGVWSVQDHGEVPPLWTIGGPEGILRDVRGITLDPTNKSVIVSDKTLNAVLTFHVPEVF